MAQFQPPQCPPISRVKISDPESPMATVYEQHDQSSERQHHQFSTSTVLNTQELTQQFVETFSEHVEFCGEPFKEEILKKVLELKSKDYKLLTVFVSTLKLTN
jgi:hypothetical protein